MPFAVETRPPCAPLSRNTGSAAPGRPAAPVLAFVKLSPVPPRQASGWHPLRCGCSVAPDRAPAVECFGCHTHTCARVCFYVLLGGESVRTKEPLEVHPASLRAVTVQAAYGAAECSGWLRSFLTPPCASPHSAPLRPPHTATPPASASVSELPRMVLRRNFPFHRRASLAQLRAAPPCRVAFVPRSTPHSGPPVPPPGAMASSVVLVTPGASALLSSFVQLGRSCGIA